MASSASAASVPPKKRKTSNASSDVESETARLLTSLGSPGSSLGDFGTGVNAETTPPKQQGANLEESHVHFPAELPHFHEQHQHDEENSNKSSMASIRNLPERRLQPKKRKMTMDSFDLSMLDRRRKMSYESYDSAMGDSALGLAPASMDNIIPKLPDAPSFASRHSGGSSQMGQQEHGVSALEHLDALGDDGAELPAPTPMEELKKGEQDNDKKPKAKLKSDDGEMKPPANKQRTHHTESLVHPEEDHAGDGDDNTSNDTFTSSGHRLLMEAFMMSSGGSGLDQGGRKRLESWGGMSDLSYGEGNTAAAIAASALQHTGIIADVTAAANFGNGSAESSVSDVDQMMKYSAVGRDRKGSTTSFSDSTFPVPASLEGLEVSSDLQKFVTAAVASVGDQLAELAGAVENAAAGVDLDSYSSSKQLGRPRLDSESSSIASPVGIGLPGADDAKVAEHSQNSAQDEHDAAKTVEAAATAAAISVDYDAVAAAVDAAQAATGALDLSAIGDNSFAAQYSATGSVSSKTKERRKLPVHNKKRSREQMAGATKPDRSVSAIHAMPPPKSTLSEAEQEAIRERARKAAGYVPPSEQTPQKSNLPPLKKRKKLTPEPPKTLPHETPKASNVSRRAPDSVPSEVFSSSHPTPQEAYSSYNGGSGSKTAIKGQSTQKWESMFESLLEFIAERKKEELDGATQEEKDEWEWDGNVPTTYKTKDGKALGRWINNQRSAKSKGTLKDERAKRLVDAGLKWSVLASNSWNEMLDELRDYVKEYTKDGKKWDGNVPTNYRIKAKPNGKKLTEEDKNLGRWVNRQRSLKQAGKLRKDRQLALEKVGLKWSMLATTSWDSMFETLVEYVEKKKKEEGKWDGNVPANYRTDDDPPRALGRWINRQRSAHVKKKLKPECVEKLTKLGLKWSVHERRYSDDPREYQNSEALKPDGVVSSNTNSTTIPTTIAVPAKVIDKMPGKVDPKISTVNEPNGKVQVSDKENGTNGEGRNVDDKVKGSHGKAGVDDKDAKTESKQGEISSETDIVKVGLGATTKASDPEKLSRQKATVSANDESSKAAQLETNPSAAQADGTTLAKTNKVESPREQKAETSQQTSSNEGQTKQVRAEKSSKEKIVDAAGQQQNILLQDDEKQPGQQKVTGQGNEPVTSATAKASSVGANAVKVEVPKVNLVPLLEAERMDHTPKTSNESNTKVSATKAPSTTAENTRQEVPKCSNTDASSLQMDVSKQILAESQRNSQFSQKAYVPGATRDVEVEESTKSTSGNAELSQNDVSSSSTPIDADGVNAEVGAPKQDLTKRLEAKQSDQPAQRGAKFKVDVIDSAVKPKASATPSRASNIDSTIIEVAQPKQNLGAERTDANAEATAHGVEVESSKSTISSATETTRTSPKEPPTLSEPSNNTGGSSSKNDQSKPELAPQSTTELTHTADADTPVDRPPTDPLPPQNKKEAASSPTDLGMVKTVSGTEKMGDDLSTTINSRKGGTSNVTSLDPKPRADGPIDQTGIEELAKAEATMVQNSQGSLRNDVLLPATGESTSSTVERATMKESAARNHDEIDNPSVAHPCSEAEKVSSKAEKLHEEESATVPSDDLRHLSGTAQADSKAEKAIVKESNTYGAASETPKKTRSGGAEIEAPKKNFDTEEAEDEAPEHPPSAKPEPKASESEGTSDAATSKEEQEKKAFRSPEYRQKSGTVCTDDDTPKPELLKSNGKVRNRSSESSGGKPPDFKKKSSSLKKLQIDMNIDMSVSRRSRSARGTDKDAGAKNGDKSETSSVNPIERSRPKRNSPRKAQRAS